VAKIKVTLVRSGIGHQEPQKRTLQSLGLRRLNQTVVHNDNAPIRGMITKVKHLVKVEIDSGDAE
jgi:large subunit ribosomal protein L30